MEGIQILVLVLEIIFPDAIFKLYLFYLFQEHQLILTLRIIHLEREQAISIPISRIKQFQTLVLVLKIIFTDAFFYFKSIFLLFLLGTSIYSDTEDSESVERTSILKTNKSNNINANYTPSEQKIKISKKTHMDSTFGPQS